MERSVKFALVLTALLLTSVGMRAEDDDFGIWTELNVEKKLTNRLDLDLFGEAFYRQLPDAPSSGDHYRVGGACRHASPYRKGNQSHSPRHSLSSVVPTPP